MIAENEIATTKSYQSSKNPKFDEKQKNYNDNYNCSNLGIRRLEVQEMGILLILL